MKKFALAIVLALFVASIALADTGTVAGPYLPLDSKTAQTVKTSVTLSKVTAIGNTTGNTTYQMLSGTAGSKVFNLMCVGQVSVLSTGAQVTVTLPFTQTAGTKMYVFLDAASGVSPTTSAILGANKIGITGVPSTNVDYLIIGR
jgi:hypothetical protein